jgi:hypothetical protein
LIFIHIPSSPHLLLPLERHKHKGDEIERDEDFKEKIDRNTRLDQTLITLYNPLILSQDLEDRR